MIGKVHLSSQTQVGGVHYFACYAALSALLYDQTIQFLLFRRFS